MEKPSTKNEEIVEPQVSLSTRIDFVNKTVSVYFNQQEILNLSASDWLVLFSRVGEDLRLLDKFNPAIPEPVVLDKDGKGVKV